MNESPMLFDKPPPKKIPKESLGHLPPCSGVESARKSSGAPLQSAPNAAQFETDQRSKSSISPGNRNTEKSPETFETTKTQSYPETYPPFIPINQQG